MNKKIFVFAVLLAVLVVATPSRSSAAIIFSIGIAPPPLPVYEQPVCPGVGYIWTPGYWAYDDVDGYFWVPATWVLAPQPGLLWTPGWWGWENAVFVFHQGYWGPHVGFYGGINYGFGYVGVGYEGGYWQGNTFFYNTSVNRVVNITNVYTKTVIVNNNVRVAYNGGVGGLTARPTAQEEQWAHERHVEATSIQTQHVQEASRNRELFESTNHGRPAIAATAKPAEFSGSGVVRASSAGPSYRPPSARKVSGGSAARSENVRPPEGGNAVHPNQLPARQYTAPNTGNAKLDQRYHQQQQKLQSQQEQERRNLQQKQEQEHKQLDQRHASNTERQQVEQKHQQQTSQLEQKHTQQQHQLEQKQEQKKR
jgi:WXXGXW repeat (2 copies)